MAQAKLNVVDSDEPEEPTFTAALAQNNSAILDRIGECEDVIGDILHRMFHASDDAAETKGENQVSMNVTQSILRDQRSALYRLNDLHGCLRRLQNRL